MYFFLYDLSLELLRLRACCVLFFLYFLLFFYFFYFIFRISSSLSNGLGGLSVSALWMSLWYVVISVLCFFRMFRKCSPTFFWSCISLMELLFPIILSFNLSCLYFLAVHSIKKKWVDFIRLVWCVSVSLKWFGYFEFFFFFLFFMTRV